jgi:hypothetical protein
MVNRSGLNGLGMPEGAVVDHADAFLLPHPTQSIVFCMLSIFERFSAAFGCVFVPISILQTFMNSGDQALFHNLP